jgi:hypothetical protein
VILTVKNADIEGNFGNDLLLKPKRHKQYQGECRKKSEPGF